MDKKEMGLQIVSKVNELKTKNLLAAVIMDRFKELEIKRQNDNMTREEFEEYTQLHDDAYQAQENRVNHIVEMLEQATIVFEKLSEENQQVLEANKILQVEYQKQESKIQLLQDKLHLVQEQLKVHDEASYRLCLYDWYLEDKGLSEDYKIWEKALDEGD